MNYSTDMEWIERYVAGTLTGTEKETFEQRLANEPDLQEELSAQRMLQHYARRSRLKKQLEGFHQEMQSEQKRQLVVVNRYSLRVFWKKHLPTMAVAASVALLTVIGTLLTMDYLRSVENRQFSYYRALKRDLDHIRQKQNSLSSAINLAPDVQPVRYSATGFMITSNGYLVTNYHVIEGADSVYVETKTDEICRYKAKEVYSDKQRDLSILKITDPDFTSPVNLPFTFKIREADLGEPVYTLAFPREDMVYGEGSVSSRTGFEGDTMAYQISIPVNPGNSGGPLLDEKGNVIGVITGKNMAAESAAFAVKSEYLLSMLDSIPADSLTEPLLLPTKNQVKELRRPEQIKQLQHLVFNVKVYNHQ